MLHTDCGTNDASEVGWLCCPPLPAEILENLHFRMNHDLFLVKIVTRNPGTFLVTFLATLASIRCATAAGLAQAASLICPDS